MNCVTQKLKPLTKNDLTAELVGKEIVCLDNTRYADATINKKYRVMSVSSNFFTFSDDTGYPCDYVIASPEDFALSSEKMHIDKENQINPALISNPNQKSSKKGDTMNYATQKLKPLTKEDLTDGLIGREVVCNSDKLIDLKVGKRYEVIDIDLKQGLIIINDDVGDLRDLFIERFALPVEESEEKARHDAGCKGDCGGTFTCSKCKRDIGCCYGGDGDELCNDCWTPKEKQPKPVTETTYSCTLEFPDGKTVTIPGPGGNYWKTETERFDWPKKHYNDLWTKLQLHDVKHNNGKLIFKEYAIRMHKENARIISITKWTRDPNYQPPEREETFEERAIRRYPSRMRGQG